MLIGRYNYNRVTRNMRCPVCEKTKYCLVSDNGNYVICTKIQTHKPYETYNGWLHNLKESSIPPVKRVIKSKNYEPNLEYIAKVYGQLDFSFPKLYELETVLNISATVFQSMGVGQLGRVWCFPMYNAKHQMIGLKKRNKDGYKWCVEHSRLGVYLSNTFDPNRRVYVCEGESDTAAMLSQGFNAIGRASASSCRQIIKELLPKTTKVTIVADNDSHGLGLKEANKLDEYLPNTCTVIAPKDHKDIRQWIQSGTFNKNLLGELT